MEVRKLNSDRIATMSDDELFGRVRSTRGFISRLRDQNRRSPDTEIELCYLIREVEIREARRAAHQAWLARNRRPNYRRR